MGAWQPRQSPPQGPAPQQSRAHPDRPVTEQSFVHALPQEVHTAAVATHAHLRAAAVECTGPAPIADECSLFYELAANGDSAEASALAEIGGELRDAGNPHGQAIHSHAIALWGLRDRMALMELRDKHGPRARKEEYTSGGLVGQRGYVASPPSSSLLSPPPLRSCHDERVDLI